MAVLGEVKAGRLKVVEAAESMGLSYRQAKRVWKRYEAKGDAGLVHGLRGRPSGRRKAAAWRKKRGRNGGFSLGSTRPGLSASAREIGWVLSAAPDGLEPAG